MVREKKLMQDHQDVIWSMNDNEEWFNDKKTRFETHIETSHDKFQYQRVIAGLTAFNAADDEEDGDSYESDDGDLFGF